MLDAQEYGCLQCTYSCTLWELLGNSDLPDGRSSISDCSRLHLFYNELHLIRRPIGKWNAFIC
jgi:hypothetical protein